MVAMGFQQILVCLDESGLGAQVFRQALDLARLCHGAKMHLLHVLQPLGQSIDPGAEGVMGGMPNLSPYTFLADPEVWESQIQAQMEQTQTWLEPYCTQAEQAGVAVEWSCPVGEVGATICDAATTTKPDLIVIGRRGLSGLAEAFMGSVSNYVVHHSPCSVLVVQAVHDHE